MESLSKAYATEKLRMSSSPSSESCARPSSHIVAFSDSPESSPIQPESTIADKSKAVVHSLIMSDPCIDTNGNFANTRASGGVGCRDARSFFEPEDEPSEPGSAILEGEDSTISGPVYWIAVVGLLGLIISSLTVAVTNWNRRK